MLCQRSCSVWMSAATGKGVGGGLMRSAGMSIRRAPRAALTHTSSRTPNAAALPRILPPVAEFLRRVLKSMLLVDAAEVQRIADHAVLHDPAEQRLCAVEAEFGTQHMHDPRTLGSPQHLARLRQIARERLLADHVPPGGDCLHDHG